MPRGHEAAAGKAPESAKKLLGRFGFPFLCFWVLLFALGALTAFRGNPFKTQGFGLIGRFFSKALFGEFPCFFRCFFCAFLGAWGFALFGTTPSKRGVLARSAAFFRKPFLAKFPVFFGLFFVGFGVWGSGRRCLEEAL